LAAIRPSSQACDASVLKKRAAQSHLSIQTRDMFLLSRPASWRQPVPSRPTNASKPSRLEFKPLNVVINGLDNPSELINCGLSSKQLSRHCVGYVTSM